MHALRGVDAVLPAGIVTAIAGPSGSGKSSLLRVLAALDRPTAGQVTVAGVALAGLLERQLRTVRHRHIGYVFQRPSHNLVPQLTVREHLVHAALTRGAVRGFGGAGRSSDRDRGARRSDGIDHDLDADELLDLLGIATRADRFPQELSGGEQQRLAFAQAVVGHPALVIADEPTAELDTASAAALLTAVRRLAALGTAIVVATHDTRTMTAADHVLHLRHGSVAGEVRRDRAADPRPDHDGSDVQDGDDDVPADPVQPPAEGPVEAPVEEVLAVVDATGRIQLPPEALRLFPQRRARLEVRDDGVWVSTPP